MSTSTETEELIEQQNGSEATEAEQPVPPAEDDSVKPDGELLSDAAPFEALLSRQTEHDESEAPADPLAIYASEAEGDIDRRDKQFLSALEKVLENRSAEKSEPAIEKFALGMVSKGVGIVSLALVLVMMGVALICCLFSSAPDFMLPVKLAPAAAIIIGLELLVHYFTAGKRFHVHIPSLCISAAIIVGCCFMCVSLNKSYSVTKTEYNNRSVAAQIYDSSYKELRYVASIAALNVEVDLNPDGTGKEKGLEALSTDDIVKIDVVLDGSYSSPLEFADECKGIIDGYRILGIPVTGFRFTNEGKLHTFRLDVDGRFEQDYSETKLAEKVHYVYIEDFDYLDDLEDFVGDDTLESFETE